MAEKTTEPVGKERRASQSAVDAGLASEEDAATLGKRVLSRPKSQQTDG